MTDYQARSAYQHDEAATEYESRPYYQGLLGRVRKARELKAVRIAIQYFGRMCTVLDCPCGNGRWFSSLERVASHIIAIDLSHTMLGAASKRALGGIPIALQHGDAESLNLTDNSVNHVFSYALMKHVPPEVKRAVLNEFARVSTGRMAISFTIFTPISYLLWRLRRSTAYPIWWSQLLELAQSAKLAPIARIKIGLPVIGMETIVVFDRQTLECSAFQVGNSK